MKKGSPKHTIMELLLCLLFLALSPSAMAQGVPATYTFGGNGQESLYGACVLKNGNAVIAGVSSMDGSGNRLPDRESRAWAVCVDSGGKVLWERHDGLDGISLYTSPVPLENGNVLLVLHNYMKGGLDTEEWRIVELLQDGTQVKSTKVGGRASNLTPLKEGYLLEEIVEESRFISLLDQDGNELWRVPRSQMARVIRTAISTESGTILLGTKSKEENFAAVNLVDQTGALKWAQTVVSGEGSWFSGGLVTGDGKLLLSGFDTRMIESWQTEDQIFTVCYDTDGSLLWQQNYGVIKRMDRIDDLIPVEGGYLAVGASHSNSRLKLLLLSGQGELLDQWEVRVEDTLYRTPRFCLLDSGIWVCSTVERDGQSAVELTRIDLVR